MADFENDMAESKVEARKEGRQCGESWAKTADADAIARIRVIDTETLTSWVGDDDSETFDADTSVAWIDHARREIYEAIHGPIDAAKANDDPYYVQNLTCEFFDAMTDVGKHSWRSFYVGFVESVKASANRAKG